jgi:hypothetical protein
MKTINVLRGALSEVLEVTPFKPGSESTETLDENWICKVGVVKSVGEALIVPSRTMTLKSDDNKSFKAYLTPTDTELLEADHTYIWVISLENSTTTPPFLKQEFIRLKVGSSVVDLT